MNITNYINSEQCPTITSNEEKGETWDITPHAKNVLRLLINGKLGTSRQRGSITRIIASLVEENPAPFNLNRLEGIVNAMNRREER